MPAFNALKRDKEVWDGRGTQRKPEMWKTTGKIKSAAIHWPFDAIGRCIAEASDIIIITVYWAGGGKHQAVTRETGDPQDHHLLPQTTVDLERRGDEENNNITWENALHNLLLEITCIYCKIILFSLRMGTDARGWDRFEDSIQDLIEQKLLKPIVYFPVLQDKHTILFLMTRREHSSFHRFVRLKLTEL